MLLEIIQKEKENINSYHNGHLPLSKRVLIAKEIKDPITVNKVFLICCKFIYKTFTINDHVLSGIINKVENTLYKKEENDFEALYDTHKNYIEEINNRPYSNVALACLALCNSMANNAETILNIEEYEGEDDDAYDWEEWNPDFYAANAFSGGNPFLNEGNVAKRKEFWNWYLDMILQVIHSPATVFEGVITTKDAEENKTFERHKDYDTDFIKSKLNHVVDFVIKDLNDKIDWKEIEIEGQNIGGMGMKAFYIGESGEKERLDLTYYLYSGDESTVKLMQQIKEAIYEQSPKEGTWFSYKMSIFPDKKYKIVYNFDQCRIYEDKEPNLGDFAKEFTKYPRSKDFTPDWWQEIVQKNKLNYL
jgi:predicted small secreted protein